MMMKIAAGVLFMSAILGSVVATGQSQPSVTENVNGGALWVDATPARSCRIVCEAIGQGWKAVAGPGTSQKVHPEYVCARKSDGLPGANHNYSDEVSKMCHYQSAGKGQGDTAFSCLCALN